MKGSGFILVFLILLFGSSHTSADSESLPKQENNQQEIREGIQGKEILLSLAATLQLALKNNLEIAIQSVEPMISEQVLVQEKSVFDPAVSVSLSKDRSVQQTSSAFALPPENESEDLHLEAGISAKLVTGAEAELALANNRNETNSAFAGLNPAYSSDVVLSLTQPLLKDFGIGTNKARIRIAANNHEISSYQFQSDVTRILSEVETNYWELVYALEDLEVQRESLELADDFLKITQRKVEVGVLPPVETLQAEAEKAAREESVITAEDSLHDAEDLLRRVLNLTDGPQYWEIRLIPTDKPLSVHQTSVLEDHLRAAIENRPDLNQSKVSLENKKIELKYTKNQLLPRIDLVGTLGVSGLAGDAQPQPDFQNPGSTIQNPFGGDRSDSIDELQDGDHYDYSVGIRVEYPLGNRAARSEMIMADLEKQKALFALKDLENRVIQEVREAFRQIETNRKRIAAAEASRRLAEERLRSETRRFEVGLATSHDVLEFQEKLSVAKSNELRARIDFQESLVDLERVKGTLLESKGIVL